MKHGNMRSYGTVLTEKLVNEKCTTRASPCVRYFVDAEGERVSSPEEFELSKDAYITPTEYRKRVDSLKRDGKGKFVKMETAPFEIPNTPGNYEAIDKLVEGTEAPSGANKEDEGGIVMEGDEKVLETLSEDKYPCLGEYEDIDIECRVCESIEACRVVTNNRVQEAIDNQTNYPEWYETNDDLEGLAEPEPTWTPPIAKGGKDYKSGEYTSDDELWEIVAKDLAHLRKRAIEVAVVMANRNFDERINQILGGK